MFNNSNFLESKNKISIFILILILHVDLHCLVIIIINLKFPKENLQHSTIIILPRMYMTSTI